MREERPQFCHTIKVRRLQAGPAVSVVFQPARIIHDDGTICQVSLQIT